MFKKIVSNKLVLTYLYHDCSKYIVQIYKNKVSFMNPKNISKIFSLEIANALNVTFNEDYSFCVIQTGNNNFYIINCESQKIIYKSTVHSKYDISYISFADSKTLVIIYSNVQFEGFKIVLFDVISFSESEVYREDKLHFLKRKVIKTDL